MSFTFFRKYNKIILAVGGSLLMVIFLIPQAGSMFQGDPSKQAYGWLGDQKMTWGQVHHADFEMQLLGKLSPRFVDELQAIIPNRKDENALVWHLMIHEAQQQGLYASEAESAELLNAMGIDLTQQATALRDAKASKAHLYQALRHFQMVSRLHQVSNAPRLDNQRYLPIQWYKRLRYPAPISEQQLRLFARDMESFLTVNYVVLDANDHLTDDDEPTAGQLDELFGKFADPKPGVDNPHRLDYRLPPRVKLEYIAVTLDSAIAAVKAKTDDDELYQRAHKYYTNNPKQFIPKEAFDPTAEDVAEQQIDLTRIMPQPFDRVQREIEQQLIRQDAIKKQQEAINAIAHALDNDSNRWPRNDDGAKQVPDIAQWVTLESIQQEAQATHGLLPVVKRFEDDWLTLEDVYNLEGFGKSELADTSTNVPDPVWRYIARSRELYPMSVDRLQVGVASNATVTPATGDKYVFRLIAAEKGHVPTDINEVKDDIAEDAKRLNAYNRLLQQSADKMIAQAKAEGLDKLAESLGEGAAVELLGPFQKLRFNQEQTTKQFVDGAFDKAAHIINAGQLDKIAQADRYAAIGVDGEMKVYIVEYVGFSPTTADKLAEPQNRASFAFLFNELDARGALYAAGEYPFTADAITERLGFVRGNNQSKPDQETQEDAQTPAEQPAE